MCDIPFRSELHIGCDPVEKYLLSDKTNCPQSNDIFQCRKCVFIFIPRPVSIEREKYRPKQYNTQEIISCRIDNHVSVMERYGQYPDGYSGDFGSIAYEEPEREKTMKSKNKNLKPELSARCMECPCCAIFPQFKKCFSRKYPHVGIVLNEVSRSENQISYDHESESYTEEAEWSQIEWPSTCNSFSNCSAVGWERVFHRLLLSYQTPIKYNTWWGFQTLHFGILDYDF